MMEGDKSRYRVEIGSQLTPHFQPRKLGIGKLKLTSHFAYSSAEKDDQAMYRAIINTVMSLIIVADLDCNFV